MSETTGRVLRSWLLLALEDLDGSAYRPEVHGKVEALFGASFTAQDRTPRMVRGVPREPAWRNNLDSLYDRMKKSGDLKNVDRGAPWTLSASTEIELLSLAPPASRLRQPVEETDLLADFKPNDATAYLAHLRGRVLVKNRLHEDVLRSYGTSIVRRGWAPTTDVHPRDLELHKGDDVCLGEVKVVYAGDVTRAVREAVAQLQEYRYFHYARETGVVLLAVFSEPVGDAYASYMQTLGIASAWLQDAGWNGSPKAWRLSLVP